MLHTAEIQLKFFEDLYINYKNVTFLYEWEKIIAENNRAQNLPHNQGILFNGVQYTPFGGKPSWQPPTPEFNERLVALDKEHAESDQAQKKAHQHLINMLCRAEHSIDVRNFFEDRHLHPDIIEGLDRTLPPGYAGATQPPIVRGISLPEIYRYSKVYEDIHKLFDIYIGVKFL